MNAPDTIPQPMKRQRFRPTVAEFSAAMRAKDSELIALKLRYTLALIAIPVAGVVGIVTGHWLR